MTLVLVFSIALFVAVLISDLAERSAVSTAVLFLIVGFLASPSVLGLAHFRAADPVTVQVAELALFATLFTDGRRLPLADLKQGWRLPGRALFLGMPLTVGAFAVLAHLLANLPWRPAFLLGAVLAPTDPVFASAIVRQEAIPERLRRLLNVESGLNDGLALPAVLALIQTQRPRGIVTQLLAPLGEGVAIGVAVMWVAEKLSTSRLFRVHRTYRGLAGFALALTIFALTRITGANEFLAAFAAGVAAISLRPGLSDAFSAMVSDLADVLKFAGLFILGTLLTFDRFTDVGWGGAIFVALGLVLVRPFALALALIGGGLTRREWLVAAWFGPKGFASVLYAILVLQAGLPEGERIFTLSALLIASSIIAQSSTDVPIGRWLARSSAKAA
jgi:sodium/hydrogen antiporter